MQKVFFLLIKVSIIDRKAEGALLGQCVDDGVAAGRHEDEDLREHVGDDEHVQPADGGWPDAGTLLVMGGHITLHGNGDPLHRVVRRLTHNSCNDNDDDDHQL